MMRTQHEHPSDRLHNGAVSGFEEALELVEAEFAYERAILLRSQPDHLQEELRQMDGTHMQISAATGHARRIFKEEQEAARLRTIERLRSAALAAEAALDDEASRWLGLLAEALESGDYAGLAI